MELYNLELIVQKLLGGGIEPVGDSHYDSEVLSRLEELLLMMRGFNLRIHQIIQRNDGSGLESIQKVVDLCKEYENDR